MSGFPPRFVGVCLLVAASAAGARAQDTAEHRFVYESAVRLRSVAVAGDFNYWDRNANPLISDAEGKTWRATLKLPLGKHQYKFVLNGETWITDPKAGREDDGNGNVNSVLLLAPADYRRPASPRDGVTARSALRHGASVPYLNYDRGRLTVSLRARPGDLAAVRLKLGNRRYPMSPVTADDLYARYSTPLAWNRRQDMSYTFELVDGAVVRELGANGLGVPGGVRPFHLVAREFKPFVTPAWVERSVIYQIFPDRFANGDTSNDPPDVRSWSAAPTGFGRFGGDVAGVRAHLPYLADLGISAIYFNPVFKSPSNHRYDAEDYKVIDPQFGTNAEFAALTRELRAKNIRTVMDFVFNHTATSFPPFQDILQKGESSAYRRWYYIKSYPVRVEQNPGYVAWNNLASMPKLNLANPETHDYMLGLVDHWQRTLPLAGLRLDVAGEVSPAFWRDLRKRAKSLDPRMWIVGEVWGDGSPWLTGDQWDSVMNYPFREASLRFIAEGKSAPSEYAKRLMQLYHRYVPQVSRNLMNLLSSHDTPRFLTLCKDNADLHRLAATVQFTWVGAPSIYYGEELGMRGGMDPENRRGMEWSLATPGNPMLRYYKRLIRLRNASPALQAGDPEILLADDRAGTLAYSRTLGSEIAIVAINRSDRPQTLRIPLRQNSAVQSARKTGLVDGLSGRRVRVGAAPALEIALAPLRAAVFLQRKEEKVENKSLGYQDTPLIPGSRFRVHDGTRPQPRIVRPGTPEQPAAPPSDAVVLFDGHDLSRWAAAKGGEAGWKVENGYLEVAPGAGDIQTREAFGDCQLHLEWASPATVKGEGQGRGNSGVFLMGLYEIQVLDSYENPTYADGTAGAIYGQYPPLVNACRRPGEWQTYDILWSGPRFDGERLVRPATVTILLNGIVVQQHRELLGPTQHRQAPAYRSHPPTGPLRLQDHGDLVRYRNIWYRPLLPDDQT